MVERVVHALQALTLASLTWTCDGAGDSSSGQPGEIFRFTVVGNSLPLDSIVLGQRWQSAEEYGALPGDTLTPLAPGTFAGADAIRVRRSPSGIVTALEFDYGPARDMGSILSVYETLLGRPSEIVDDTVAGEHRRATIWRDASTEFRVTRFAPGRPDSVIATAALLDR